MFFKHSQDMKKNSWVVWRTRKTISVEIADVFVMFGGCFLYFLDVFFMIGGRSWDVLVPNHASKCLVDVFSIRSHLIGVIRYLDFCDCCVIVVFFVFCLCSQSMSFWCVADALPTFYNQWIDVLPISRILKINNTHFFTVFLRFLSVCARSAFLVPTPTRRRSNSHQEIDQT